VAYTVAAVEIGLRGLGQAGQAGPVTSVAEQVPETTRRLIQKLVGSLQLELDLFFGKGIDRTPLRVGIFARFMHDWYRTSTLPTPLLNRNPLVLVIETAAIAPDLLHATIHMAYFAELTRVTLGACMWIKRCLNRPASARSSPPADPHLAQGLAIWRGFKGVMAGLLRQHAGAFADTDVVLGLVSDEELAKIMYSLTLPFLRRCAIVFYACAERYPVPQTFDSDACEYTRLLALLGLPSPVGALTNADSPEGPMVGKWLTQWVFQGRQVPMLEFPGVYELVRLPAKWEVAVNRYMNHRCGRCGNVPANPALCLLCGKFLCLGGDCCAAGEQGECNAHMRECGGAVGLFVDIKRWQMLYLYAGSGSFGAMPYLDQHGELDIAMR
jgi:E3 ubiquitin-protein ligase UBR1